MRDALIRLGYEVHVLLNGNEEDMAQALEEFEASIKNRGGLALFHYGGHGIQVDGENYLIPVDVDIPDERRVRYMAMNIGEVVESLIAAGSSSNVIILDACRGNPLPASVRIANSRGLAAIQRKPYNSIVIYAAEAGSTAQDGLFTPALLKYLEIPDMEIGELLRKVRSDVWNLSGGKQQTGEYNQLMSEIYLAGGSFTNEAAPGTVGIKREAAYSADMTESAEGKEGMIFIEGGIFMMGSDDAPKRSRPEHEVFVGDFWMGIHEVTQGEWQDVMGSDHARLTECQAGGGIGADYPMFNVEWLDAIEYCNKRSQLEGLHPCYSITKDEITCNFGVNGYRLPTEAEWEFAARGGLKSEGYQYAGSDSSKDVAWYGFPLLTSNFAKRLVQEVETKEPNELGIYDMSGNIAEWCWDVYESYGESKIGMVNSFIETQERSMKNADKVVRGGNWTDSMLAVTVFYREGKRNSPVIFTDVTTEAPGFRVVRSN